MRTLKRAIIEVQASKLVHIGVAFLFILIISSGLSSSQEAPVTVNVMIDVNSDPSYDLVSENALERSVINLSNGIDAKGLDGTFYLTGDAVMQMRLILTSIGNSSNHELAIGGMSLGERLSTISYSSQKSLLEEAKRRVNACRVCGDQLMINGFKPQGLDQNEDTYSILRGIDIAYDAGFSDGVRYLPGHQNDSWPYPTEVQGLYAVPMSTHSLSGEMVYLSDRAVLERGLNGSQWYDLLVSEFEESSESGSPVVVAFDNLISGTRQDYLEAYLGFIDYASSRSANFVTTSELVNMSSNSSSEYPGTSEPAESGCTECDNAKSSSAGSSAQDASPKFISVEIKPNNESIVFKDS
jgi:hypothetical protein